MTQITATVARPTIVVDRDWVVIAVLSLIGLFVSLGLMLLMPADASLLAAMS